jgi:CubicO group peptidase (beta-lactamase class C family)
MPTSEPGLERARQVDAIFGEFISKNTPGGVVLVIHEGRILYEAAYGLADIKNKTPLTTQSILHLGSIGKHFTAVAVVLLAEQGKLNLDDPIEKYFPELSRFGQDVTIRRLLQHTSGIPDYYDNRPLAKVNQRT